jgi:magnesium-transporting ATPase (P-type)
MRDGREVEVLPGNIVVGDLCHVRTGDKVHFNGYIIKASGLTADEPCEGSFVEAKKDTYSKCLKASQESTGAVPSPFLLKGSNIFQGEGWYVCLGYDPEFDVIQPLAEKVSHMESEIESIVRKFRFFGLAVGIVVFVAMALRHLQDPSSEPLIGILIIPLTIFIISNPECLHSGLSIIRSFVFRTMVIDKLLVKEGSAVEKLGKANVIVVDKTGTITKNIISIGSIYAGG